MVKHTVAACVFVAGSLPLAAAEPPAAFDAAAAQRFADLALACVHKEYPNKIAHVLAGDADVKPPRELTPAFCGCFDWHSAVHGHWLLVRLARTFPDAPFVPKARAALAASLTPEHIAREVALPRAARGAPDFERPYGLAWLLQLAAELREWDDPQAQEWARTLEPLERRRGGAARGLAAQALVPDPDRRAQPDRVRLRPRARLGARDRRRGDGRARSSGAAATTTSATATARWPTSPRGRTSSRRAWPRPT